jgi:hypothetical protein
MDETTKTPIVDGEAYDAVVDVNGQEDNEVLEVKVQEMRRNFRFVSIFGFSMILMASWETMLG